MLLACFVCLFLFFVYRFVHVIAFVSPGVFVFVFAIVFVVACVFVLAFGFVSPCVFDCACIPFFRSCAVDHLSCLGGKAILQRDRLYSFFPKVPLSLFLNNTCVISGLVKFAFSPKTFVFTGTCLHP